MNPSVHSSPLDRHTDHLTAAASAAEATAPDPAHEGGRARRAGWLSALLAGLLLTGCAGGTDAFPDPDAGSGSGDSGNSETAPDPEQSNRSVMDSENGTIVLMAEELVVRDVADADGYERDKFGDGWQDPDGNGCDARNDMLARDLVDIVVDEDGCTVLTGVLEVGPFTGERIVFERGGSSEIDIDHLVALADAWDSGAGEWSKEQRVAFANDPNNLLSVSSSANRSKGADSFDEWTPPRSDYNCTYAQSIVSLKTSYELTVTASEKDALLAALAAC